MNEPPLGLIIVVCLSMFIGLPMIASLIGGRFSLPDIFSIRRDYKNIDSKMYFVIANILSFFTGLLPFVLFISIIFKYNKRKAHISGFLLIILLLAYLTLSTSNFFYAYNLIVAILIFFPNTAAFMPLWRALQAIWIDIYLLFAVFTIGIEYTSMVHPYFGMIIVHLYILVRLWSIFFGISTRPHNQHQFFSGALIKQDLMFVWVIVMLVIAVALYNPLCILFLIYRFFQYLRLIGEPGLRSLLDEMYSVPKVLLTVLWMVTGLGILYLIFFAGDGEGVESEEGGLFGDGGLFDVDIPDIPETPDLEAPLDIGGTEFIAGSALGSESMAEHGRNIWGYEMPPLEKVSGYFRDGTYVAEHVRTVKDGVTYNNLRPK